MSENFSGLPLAAESTWPEPVAKIGARNSRADLTDIQLVHDAATRLGAVCYAHGPEVEKAVERSLYVSRPLLNADSFIAWAKQQGFKTTLQAGDLHVTIAYSRAPVAWPAPVSTPLTADDVNGREVTPLGDGGAVVLKFKSKELNERWDYLRSVGAGWDHFQFTPHVTISWDAADVDLSKVHPYTGELLFGPEKFKPIDENWKDSVTEKSFNVAKVDTDLGIVFGWAIISKIRGVEYYDTQGDHIPEDSMLRAAADYVQESRIAGNMHRYANRSARSVERVGEVVFAFPLTSEIAVSMGISSPVTGFMIGMKVTRPDILEKFKDGTYTGFSIGGVRIRG